MMTADADTEALELCLKTVLEGPEDRKGRHKQIGGMAEENRAEASQLCSYLLQKKALGLKPWDNLPCWGDDVGNAPTPRLVRRLRKHGISIYHPDPLRALQEIGAGNGYA
jgi:hypothetical protein